MWPPETLCRPPEGRSWKKPECFNSHSEAGEKTLALEDGRSWTRAPEPQSPGPDSSKPAPPRQLSLSSFLPSLCLTDYSSFQVGYLAVPRQLLSPLSLWDGLYTCTKSREPVLYISPEHPAP